MPSAENVALAIGVVFFGLCALACAALVIAVTLA